MPDKMAVHRFLVFLFVLNWVVCLVSANSSSQVEQVYSSYVSDVCDWHGSKSTTSDPDRSVVPIYLRCSRGSIKWFYPTGGLRVVLKLGTGGKDFRGCIRVSQNTTRNVRIYIEGKKQLYQIFSTNDGFDEDRFRCFVSDNGFMALFVETDPSSPYPHDHVIFNYDLQPITTKSALLEDQDECKPCSEKQILALYCSADFVLSGKVTFFHDRPELDLTEFTVKPLYMYRFPMNSTYISDTSAAALAVNTNLIDNDEHPFRVTLNRPLKCHSRASPRIPHLLLGREVLGKLFITCAPKMQQWRELSQRAVAQGNTECYITDLD